MAQKTIRGPKGGNQAGHIPAESPKRIQSIARAKMLLTLGEGEFAGGLGGKNICLDGIPIIPADGTENFPLFRWDFRPETQAQDYI